MYPRVRKINRPPRKQDFYLPDGNIPDPKQWFEAGKWHGRFDRARIKEELQTWVDAGLLIYVPRVDYRVELRQSVRQNGKAVPKTLKTWFVRAGKFNESSLASFWRNVRLDLVGFAVSPADANRIEAKIAERIPQSVVGTE